MNVLTGTDLKPRYYNPDSKLQKSGHASYVDLPNGETWMVHLTSRPFVPGVCAVLWDERLRFSE